MVAAYINRIGTAVPPFDVHQRFIDYARELLPEERARRLFHRMADRAQIAHRYSFLQPATDERLDALDFYRRGRFPDTGARMRFFEDHAFGLAAEALEDLRIRAFRDEVTHLIVVSCTGFYAPGLDIEIANRFALKPSVERTVVGFMGCCAAINALNLARHMVQSEPRAKVVVVNVELCTIHLQETHELEQILCFLLWGDGCSATLVSAEASGIELRNFHSMMIPDSLDQMSWRIGRGGFDMVLSGNVPLTLSRELPRNLRAILGARDREEIAFWAVHPGGRSILDAVAEAIHLDDRALHYSRDVLHRFGNMSSATIMFILKAMLEARPPEGLGCGIAFGPGLTAESMIFAMTG